MTMFIRKKKNKIGSVSIQILLKVGRKNKLLKTIGCSSSLYEINKFYKEAEDWIKNEKKQKELDFTQSISTDTIFDSIKNISNSGIILLLGKIFDSIGFNKIDNYLLKYLSLAKLSFPVSKLKTTEYLRRYHNIDWSEDKIYRYLDKLYNEHKELIQQISYKHTLKILNGVMSIVFYDVTTLYFQIDNEDNIRKRGFSKEGKHQNPQIVLGLLVSIDGYPLAFDIFEGNKFEGHTMLPVLDSFKKKYKLEKLVIVADSGLLSTQNIKELQDKNYEFILGARIKNEKQAVKDKILALELKNGKSKIIDKEYNLRLIVSYSDKRAKKDNYNRERGLKRLEKQLKSGKLTKSSINNKGYNKYLKMEGDVKISIDIEKFNQDAKWDGLKGYITNSTLSKDEIIENYGQLWKIEKAFRISKHDLKIRPIYHRLQRRIEAHITINFVAYKIHKELERQLKIKKANISPDKAIDIAKAIYSVKIENPGTKEVKSKTLIFNEEQRNLAKLFDF